jgi:hypothetical protein
VIAQNTKEIDIVAVKVVVDLGIVRCFWMRITAAPPNGSRSGMRREEFHNPLRKAELFLVIAKCWACFFLTSRCNESCDIPHASMAHLQQKAVAWRPRRCAHLRTCA